MVDTRIWNIVPLAALLVAGCQPAGIMIPIDESETGDGDGDPSGDGDGDGDGDPSGDGDGDGDGDPSGDGDGDGDPTDGDDFCDDDPCPEGWSCISFGTSGYCYPECYDGDGQCDLGEACFDNSCETLDDLLECEGPTLIELPIPAPAQGEVLDLSFGDLDGDNLDELLVLHAGELVVVRDGVTSSTVVVDPLADEVTALHVDDDGNLDVFLSSAEDNHAAVLLGVGDGSLMSPEPRTLLALQHTRALDWPMGGANELVGIDTNGDPFQVSELAVNPPVSTTVDLEGWDTDTVVAIHPGDFDADGLDDLLIHDVSFSGPRYFLVSQLQDVLSIKFFGFHDMSFDARSTAFARAPGLGSGYVFTLQHGAETDIHVYYNDTPGDDEPDNAGVIASAEIHDLTHVGGLGLVLATASDTKLIEMDDLALGCISSPAVLPASTRVVAGDFANNEGDELALVDDQGLVRVWGRLP